MLPGSRCPRSREPITKSASPRATGPTTSRNCDGHVAAVAIEEAHDVGVGAHRREPAAQGAAVAALRLAHHARAAARARAAVASVEPLSTDDHLVGALRQTSRTTSGMAASSFEAGDDELTMALRPIGKVGAGATR
jgi:hypothetical protein